MQSNALQVGAMKLKFPFVGSTILCLPYVFNLFSMIQLTCSDPRLSLNTLNTLLVSLLCVSGDTV